MWLSMFRSKFTQNTCRFICSLRANLNSCTLPPLYRDNVSSIEGSNFMAQQQIFMRFTSIFTPFQLRIMYAHNDQKDFCS